MLSAIINVSLLHVTVTVFANGSGNARLRNNPVAQASILFILPFFYEDMAEDGEEPIAKQVAKKDVKDTHVSIHSPGFGDFALKPELLRGIVDCGLEHPSEVQYDCIPHAI